MNPVLFWWERHPLKIHLVMALGQQYMISIIFMFEKEFHSYMGEILTLRYWPPCEYLQHSKRKLFFLKLYQMAVKDKCMAISFKTRNKQKMGHGSWLQILAFGLSLLAHIYSSLAQLMLLTNQKTSGLTQFCIQCCLSV